MAQIRAMPRVFIIAGIVFILLLLIIIIAAAVSHSRPHYDSSNRIIDGKYVRTPTSCGWVQGFVDEPGFTFLGIPYSVPPVGDRRWLPSQTQNSIAECWEGTYMAYNRSLPCWYFSDNGYYDGVEDCLKLDVYTPKVSYDNPLPVIVFIGGESLHGGLNPTLRPSSELAVFKSVVFVHIQYRMGVLGFLSLEKFLTNEKPPRTGNYGLSDLHTALEWVQLNIEHFGGDPNAVTILGHGAGATLGTAALSSLKFRDLFSQAWLTGGAGYFRNLTLREVDQENKPFLRSVDCSDVQCLRDLSTEELMEQVPEEWKTLPEKIPRKGEKQHAWLVVDGKYLRGNPKDEWSERGKNDVPTVIGMNKHEDASTSLYTSLDWSGNKEEVLEMIQNDLGTFSGELAGQAIQMYQGIDDPWALYTQMVSDIRTVCPLLKMSRDISANFASKVFAYVAIHPRNNTPGFITDALSDIQAILGVYEEFSSEDAQFINNMQDQFYTFVYDGIMKDNQRVPRNLYLLGDEVKTVSNYPNCDFWSKSPLYPDYARTD